MHVISAFRWSRVLNKLRIKPISRFQEIKQFAESQDHEDINTKSITSRAEMSVDKLISASFFYIVIVTQ